MFGYQKEIKELKQKLEKERVKNLELQSQMWEIIAKERWRIDRLITDVENKFNSYMEEYSKANIILTKHREPPVFRIYSELDNVKTIEYGEIKIPQLHIRFIKGEKK